MARLVAWVVLLSLLPVASATAAEPPVRIATFQVDATPPLGSPLCDGLVPAAMEIVDPLSARGLVLLSAEEPIVLCAVDWVDNADEGYDAWREALATAAGTTRERVAVHTLHQHDAPGCDLTAERMLAERGLGGQMMDEAFARETIERAAQALRDSLARAQIVTHLGVGLGRVERVASNRRILGADGKVQFIRYSSCRDETVRAAPEGTIDPFVRLVSFWNEDRPLVVLTYYATHPQSFYGKGGVSADFVGLARRAREAGLPEAVHIHFDGAGGNVAAGKYNDGSPENRPVLAGRLEEGMKAALNSIERVPLTAADVSWRTCAVALPVSPHLDENELQARLDNPQASVVDRLRAARDLAWVLRAKAGGQIDLGCLRLGSTRILHMPGELFVEYQLAAQEMRPDLHVCMAAYGDDGPGYIGTRIAYSQGGYETGPVSRVSPDVEEVLMNGIRLLLE